ncbi:MAG: lipid asymmetry maintenance protein MlaB [Isosphaeraceae bacterium]
MPPESSDRSILSVSLHGPITLYESVEVREILRAALAERKDLRVDLDASGPWDLAGLQLLVSLVNSCEKAGRSVRLVNVPGVCREIAERSGLGDWLAGSTDSFG